MLTLDSSESIILSRKLRTFAYQLTKGETLGSSWNSPSPSSTYPVNHQVLNVLLFSQIAYSFPLPLILPYFRPSSALPAKTSEHFLLSSFCCCSFPMTLLNKAQVPGCQRKLFIICLSCKIRGPRGVHILILEICECVTFHGRHFVI